MSNAMSKCGCTPSASFENKKDNHEPGPQTGTIPELASTARGSHPTLLLMAGFAGAGKTTLATKLKEEFLQCGDQSWEVLDKDLLKRKHLEEGQEVELAGWKAFEDLFNLIAQKAINNKKSVIIDTSNERPFIHENILVLLEHMHRDNIQANFNIILCVASKEKRSERLDERGSMFYPFVKNLPPTRDDSDLFGCFEHLARHDPKLRENLQHLSNNPADLKDSPYLASNQALIVNTNLSLETIFPDVWREITTRLQIGGLVF